MIEIFPYRIGSHDRSYDLEQAAALRCLTVHRDARSPCCQHTSRPASATPKGAPPLRGAPLPAVYTHDALTPTLEMQTSEATIVIAALRLLW